MWPSPFHNTWESNEDFMDEEIPLDQFNTGTYWDDTWNSPPGQWYSPGSALQEPIFGATGFGADLPSEEDRFHADEVELGRRRRGRGRGRRPRTVVLPGGKEETMGKVKVKRGKKNGTVKVAAKTGFPHQVERRAVTRAKRVLRSKGYRGVTTQATMWFPIITPIGPIPYNYNGYTPVLVHFKFTSKRSSAPARRPSQRAPARDNLRDYYEEEEGGFYEEDLAPSGGGGDWAQDVPDVESGTFDQYFGLDILDDADQGNEFLVEE